jgi:hypothetical protein
MTAIHHDQLATTSERGQASTPMLTTRHYSKQQNVQNYVPQQPLNKDRETNDAGYKLSW